MQNLIDRLQRERFCLSTPLAAWDISQHVNVPAPQARSGQTAWVPLEAEWGTIPGTWWIRTRVSVPAEAHGKPLYAELSMHSDYPVGSQRFPWVVGLNQHFEGLLYVNGVPVHGLDPNRSQVMLTPRAESGATLELLIEAFTRSAKPKRFQSKLALLDPDINGLYYDVLSLDELARGLEMTGDTSDPLQAERMDTADFDADSLRPVREEIIDILTTAEGVMGTGTVEPEAARDLRTTIRERLQLIRHPLGQSTIELVGHCHIDTAWLWRIAETRRKVGRTFATILRYMEEFPQFTYIQTAPVLYEYCRDDYPELYERVREAVAAGRWDPEGGMRVEADCNMTSGESLVRQLLYGIHFMEKEFGTRCRVLWLPDVFGFTGALPQLLRQAGIDLFVNMKLESIDGAQNPYCNFWWEGIDGTRVMAHNEHGYIKWGSAQQMLETVLRNNAKVSSPDANLLAYGFGDGGGGPTRADIELANRWGDLPFFPKLSFTTASRFAGKLAEVFARSDADAIPVHQGEYYLENHRGTYTSVARVKLWNRRCESRLAQAETWASLAAICGDAPYPAERVRKAWKQALLNQFHDILPGSSIEPVYDDARQAAEAALTAGVDICHTAWQALPGKETTGPLVVNSLGEEAGGLVNVPTDFADSHCQAMVDDDDSVEVMAWCSSRPGWSVTGFDPVVPPAAAFRWDGDLLETPFWRATFGAAGSADAGCITELYDKANDRQVCRGPLNRLQTFHDMPEQCEPWELDPEAINQPIAAFFETTTEVAATGPLVFVMRIRSRGSRSTIVQDVRFYATTPRIDFVTHVDWHEHRVLLKAAFPLNIDAEQSTAETAFGWQPRPMLRDTPAQRVRFETPMHRWIDLSDEDYGISLLNDCKYGYDGEGHTLRLTLLKSAGYAQLNTDKEELDVLKTVEHPAGWADEGKHTFTYALWPHTGTPVDGGTLREARLLNTPLELISSGQPVPGMIATGASNIVAECLKQAENGDGFMLRLYEASGRPASCTLRLGFHITAWQECTIMEAVDADAVWHTAEPSLSFRPFEVKTLALRVGP